MALISGGIFILKKTIRYFFVVAFVIAYFVCPGTSKAQSAQTQTPVSVEKTAAVVFTEKDRTTALERFDETKADFLNEIKDLSEAQLNFKESPDRWSVAEVAEHIILAENLIYSLLTDKVLKAPVPEGKDNFRIKDQAIWMVITNRSTKFKAPERIQPKGLYKTKAELISNFEKNRKITVDFVKTTKEDLRNRFGENPGIGMIDGYQWLIFLNGHSHRHLDQIREIKADPNFPKK
jgi:hypothetical protein